MKIALLISGELRQFWYSADSIFNNLIKPNNLDVFLITGPNHIDNFGLYYDKEEENNIKTLSMSESRENQYKIKKLNLTEYEFIKKKFGNYLKDLNKNCYIKNYWDQYIQIKKEAGYLSGQNFKNLSLDKWCFKEPTFFNILQYLLFKEGIEMIENYEKNNNIKYDYIFRIRPDIKFDNICDINLILNDKKDIYLPPPFGSIPNQIYRMDYNNYCYHDYFFLFKREIIKEIKNFVFSYGKLKFLDDNYNNNLFEVEKQWYLYLNSFNFTIGSLHSTLNLIQMDSKDKHCYSIKFLKNENDLYQLKTYGFHKI